MGEAKIEVRGERSKKRGKRRKRSDRTDKALEHINRDKCSTSKGSVRSGL